MTTTRMLAVVVALVVLNPLGLDAAPRRSHTTKVVAKHPKAKPTRPAPRTKLAARHVADDDSEAEAKPRAADKAEPKTEPKPEPAVEHTATSTVAQVHDEEEPPARKRPK